MTQYDLSPEAENDLAEAWFYLSREAGEKQADTMIDKIEAQCQSLAKSPGTGRARDELRPGLRSFPINPFTIFYDVIARNHIVVRRVLHQKRDIDSIMGQ